MAEQLQEVRARLRSVQNTLQITKAMKMASENKLKKAEQMAKVFGFYVQKSEELLLNLQQANPYLHNNYLTPIKEDTHSLFIVISSNKGLCGAYNSNIFKRVHEQLQHTHQATILNIGRKAFDHFNRYSYPLLTHYQTLIINDKTTTTIYALIAELMQQFKERKYTSIYLAYSHFVNPLIQRAVLRPLLPFIHTKNNDKNSHIKKNKENIPSAFFYESGLTETLSYLLQHTLRALLYEALLDAQAAEHGARVSAMDQASENAKKMLDELKISYNRARQAIITNEIIEIISGGEAS